MPRTNQFILLALSCLACSKQDAPPPPPTPPPASAATATAPATWTVRANGIGPLRVGATLREISATLGEELRAVYDISDECAEVRPTKVPAGVSFMILSDTLARVDVDSAGVATTEGARVGDSEASVLQLYAGRIRVEPHKYTGPEGHYLVVTPPGDTLHRIIFETDGQKVTTFRSGRRPAVDYVEGCA